jgi:hypothetical protein
MACSLVGKIFRISIISGSPNIKRIAETAGDEVKYFTQKSVGKQFFAYRTP